MIDFLQILELDKLRFFELTLFNLITGNYDIHQKNFSMYLSDMGWVLSPAYDLLNLKIVLPDDKDDTALLLGG
jgi:serine/threonine-protein kinase HipA